MKKVAILVLVAIFTIMLAIPSLAAPDLGAGVTTTANQYDKSNTNSNKDSSLTNFEETAVPKALPKTGGIPAAAFYVVGGICIVSALLLSRKKAKAQ